MTDPGNDESITDHDRSVRAATSLSAAALTAREEGGETPEQEMWLEYAVDPRTDRPE